MRQTECRCDRGTAFIQIRNVSEELREAAKRRAQQHGVDLSTYVRSLLERDLARPSMNEWLDDVLAGPVGRRIDTAALVRESRSQRDADVARAIGRRR